MRALSSIMIFIVIAYIGWVYAAPYIPKSVTESKLVKSFNLASMTQYTANTFKSLEPQDKPAPKAQTK